MPAEGAEGPLKLADMAIRPDFRLGSLSVSPSRRLVEGPAGKVYVEPLVMQVLLLLLDARGRVVTRTELFDECWGGTIVGDDSLNRAIAKVRRIASETAPGDFQVETIPRTGYRLTGDLLRFGEATDTSAPSPQARPLSRRIVIGGGVAAAAVIGASGVWWATRDEGDPRARKLSEQGEAALRVDDPSASKLFSQAVAVEPRNARAWGLLAYSLAAGADGDSRAVPTGNVEEAVRAARTALGLDPQQPDALLAVTIIQSEMLDWISRETKYREILAIAPDNTRAMRSLAMMLHGVGRCRDALNITNRALRIEPLSPDLQSRRALRLWVLGREAEADRVIDRAAELWPSHRMVRLGRLMIYAFTGRAPAALALVDDEKTSGVLLSSAAASVWRQSLRALETRVPPEIADARQSLVEASKRTPAIAAWAILILSELRELDAAFAVANGFLLGRGSVIVRPRPESRVPVVNRPSWRNTFGLFTPPTAAMRLDPRFDTLAEGLGLTDYWRRRGIGPDRFLFRS